MSDKIVEYLKGIKDNTASWGSVKVLLVRKLSIDFKHRDTEFNIRTPKLVEDLPLEGYKELMVHRAHQLRCIYHLSRAALKGFNPQHVADKTYGLTSDQLPVDGFTTRYVNFNEVITGNVTATPYDMLFSITAKQRDMINYFLTHKIELPKEFLCIKDVKELADPKRLVSVVDSLATYEELKYLWLRNVYVFTYMGLGYSEFKLKTDVPILP